jgi:hypothetical protein
MTEHRCGDRTCTEDHGRMTLADRLRVALLGLALLVYARTRR